MSISQININNEIHDLRADYNTQNKKLATIDDIKNEFSGIAGAMEFKGVLNSLPTSNSDYNNGDVIIVGNKDYIFNGSSWIELGDEGHLQLAINEKQDKLTGTQNQIVGFDESGNAKTIEMPNEIEVSNTAPTDENVEVWIKPDDNDNNGIEPNSSTYNLIIGIETDGYLTFENISSSNISIKQGSVATVIEKIKNRQDIKVTIEYSSYYGKIHFMGICNPHLVTVIDNGHLAIETFISAVPNSDYYVEKLTMKFNSNGTLSNIDGRFIAYAQS